MLLHHQGTPAEARRRRERRVRESLRLQDRLAWQSERGWQIERHLAALRREPAPNDPPAPAPPPITLLLLGAIIGVYFMDRLLAREALAWIVGGLDYADQLGDLAAAVIPVVFISVEIWLGYHLAQVWQEYQEDRVPGLWVALWVVFALLVPVGVVAAVVYANWGDWATPFIAAPFVLAGHLVCVMSGASLDRTLRWLIDTVARWRRRRAIPRAERELRRMRSDVATTLQRLCALHHDARADDQELLCLPLPKRGEQWLAEVVGSDALEALRGTADEVSEPPQWAAKARRLPT